MAKISNAIKSMIGRRPSGPVKNTSATSVRYVFVDTELTGIDERKDSIISIGCLGMLGARIEFGDSFSLLVSPRSDFNPKSVVIHGITPSDVDKQPEIEPVLWELLKFCGDDILVGHCIAIDLGFLNREMKLAFGKTIKNPAVDTYSLFEFLKRRMPEGSAFSDLKKEFRLYDIAKKFGIAVAGGHNALMDSYITAQLFQRFLPLLLDLGIESVGDLLRVGNPSRGGDVFRSSEETCSL